MVAQPLQHSYTMETKFLHPVMHFTPGPSSQEPYLLPGSPLHCLKDLYYTVTQRAQAKLPARLPGEVPQLPWTLPGG